MSQRLHIAICALLVVLATDAFAQQRQIYTYTARTAETVRRQGAVTAAGITWSCQGQACTITGPWPRPILAGCRALAAEIGTITYFGRDGAALDVAGIAACNAGVVRPITPPVRTPPIIRSPAIIGAPNASTPNQTAANGPVSIVTPELAFVGGATIDTSDRAAATVTVNAPEIAFVGGASLDTSDRAAPPVTINTPEIAFVGQ